MHRTSLRAVLIASTALTAAPLFAVLTASSVKAQMITQGGGNGGGVAGEAGGQGGLAGGGGGASSDGDGRVGDNADSTTPNGANGAFSAGEGSNPGTGGTGSTSATGSVSSGANGSSTVGGGGGGSTVISVTSGAQLDISVNHNGGNGGSDVSGSGNTGGGGGGAGMVFTATPSITPNVVIDFFTTITGGTGGGGVGGGGGGAGVFVDSGGAFSNFGTLQGGDGGASSSLAAGAGGAGLLANNATITNNETIKGGDGGTTTTGTAGAGGNGVELYNSSLTNNATITGGSSGGTGAADGAGVVVNSGGSSVTNSLTNWSTISGGGTSGVGVAVNAEGFTVYNAGSIAGGGSADAVDLTGQNDRMELWSGGTFTGKVVASGDTATFALGGDGTTDSFDISKLGATGQFQGFTSFDKSGTSTWTLTGTSTFAGPATVSAGTLLVNGDTTSFASTTVLNGATLGGTGTLSSTTVNSGGIFAPGDGTPGSFTTLARNLTLESGAIYMVQINPSTASYATVFGGTNLGGATVNAVFANGSYIAKQYTILNAFSTLNGTFNSTVTNTNLPAGFQTALSYDATDVYLNLALNLDSSGGGQSSSGLNLNQQRLASTLENFFNTNGGIPMVFGGLTPQEITMVSGEVATGSQQTTFDAMSMFLGLMTDPSSATRGEPVTPASPAQAYAEMPTKAFPRFQPAYTPGWRVWSAGFGGSETTQGNSTIGSNDATSRIFGGAAGADYHISPDTLFGFALAGGGTNFSVANGGTGRSDLFQAGTYMRHSDGAAYVTAALAYGWQDIITNRSIGADQLRAEFNANAYSGRIEGGYRFSAFNGLGFTPYAAAQSTLFDLPGYSESTAGTGLFALSYDAKSVVDTRSELGFRTDKAFALDNAVLNNAVLTLRGRAAWAHDFNTDRSVAATFQSLPGASFVVDGAAQAPNSALVSASAELAWHNGWSVAGTFDGEFSDVTQSYAAKGVVRYDW